MPELDASEWLMVVAGAVALGWFWGRRSARPDRDSAGFDRLQILQSAEAAFSRLSPATQQEADQLILSKKYIEAVKLVRNEASLDLRDAKHAIDNRKCALGVST